MKLSLFPYPHEYRGETSDGSILPVSPICQRCPKKVCRDINQQGVKECSYGFNYLRVDPDLVIFGFVLQGNPRCSQARSKRLRDHKAYLVTSSTIENLVGKYTEIRRDFLEEISREKERILQEYAQGEHFKVRFLQDMEEKIARGLSFVHDYRQINSQISQQINVLLETRYPGQSMEDKLGQATAAEESIYHASKLLNEKLNVAKFLLHPEWLAEQDQCTSFKLHGLIMKYLWIYSYSYKAMDIQPFLGGSSHEYLRANPEACGVIPQTFMDNALKYSQPGGKVRALVDDDPQGIYFSVTSYGPRIEADELDKIFEPFYRGVNAQKTVKEGAGYGLYVSQLIAKKHFGTQIQVEQSSEKTSDWGYETCFSILFPFRALILP